MEQNTRKSHIINASWIILLNILLILADLKTKEYAATDLMKNGPVELIKGVLEFRYVENAGAAFGMFQNARTFFLVASTAVLILIVSVLLRMPATRKYLPLRICMAVISAGAIGNMIDRIKLSYVRDFIYVSLIDFPVFNVADICVTCGTAALIILMLAVYKDEDFAFLSHKKEPDKKEPADRQEAPSEKQ